MRISDWSSDVCSSDLVLEPVEAVLRDEVGRIALAYAAPLRRDDVGVVIFALVVEHFPVVEADAGGRLVDVPFADHRGRIARLAECARPDPDTVDVPMALLRKATTGGLEARSAGWWLGKKHVGTGTTG